MNNKALAILFAAVLALVSVAPAYASGTPDPAAAAADAVLARPLGFAATVIGSAIFVVSLPVAATSGSIDSAARSLVGRPAEFTFTRPLGNFDYPNYRVSMSRRHPKSQGMARRLSMEPGSKEISTAGTTPDKSPLESQAKAEKTGL